MHAPGHPKRNKNLPPLSPAGRKVRRALTTATVLLPMGMILGGFYSPELLCALFLLPFGWLGFVAFFRLQASLMELIIILVGSVTPGGLILNRIVLLSTFTGC